MNTTIEKYLAIVKAHERLILVIVAGLFAVHFYSRGIDYLTKRDQTEAQTAALVAAQSETVLKQQQADFTKQLTSIQLQIAQRNQQNVVQKQQDSKMSTPELAARIANLLQINPQQVTQSALPNHLDLDPNAAHTVTSALEDGATCKVDLAQTQLVLLQSQALTGTTQTTLDLEKVSHQADVKELKSKSRNSWLRGFKVGFIVGIVGEEAIRIAVTHKP